VETEAEQAERNWVAANADLVSRAFDGYMQTGAWPQVDELQRALDRAAQNSDVREALRHLPRMAGEPVPWEPNHAVIPLRLLRYWDAARPVLDVCLDIVHLCLLAYQSDDPEPRVTSEQVNAPTTLAVRAGDLLSSSSGSPLGSGSSGNGYWSYEIAGSRVRVYQRVQSVEDYFTRQAELIFKLAPRSPLAAPLRRRLGIFLIMPFGCSWSDDTYLMIKEVTGQLETEQLEVDVFRADDIAAPGKITDQIMEAIGSSDAIIADITDTNPNVMWELGYAQALEKPVVILNQDVEQSPFDLRDWRQVGYGPGVDESRPRIIRYLRGALENAGWSDL